MNPHLDNRLFLLFDLRLVAFPVEESSLSQDGEDFTDEPVGLPVFERTVGFEYGAVEGVSRGEILGVDLWDKGGAVVRTVAAAAEERFDHPVELINEREKTSKGGPAVTHGHSGAGSVGTETRSGGLHRQFAALHAARQ